MVPVSVYTVVDLKKPTGENPEYKKWEKEYDDRIEYLEQINPSIKIDFESYGKLKDFFKERDEFLERDKILKNILSRRPAQFNYPPGWVPYIGGIIASLISLIAVLFGIRGATRGIKWVTLWTIEGFKDKKKSKSDP